MQVKGIIPAGLLIGLLIVLPALGQEDAESQPDLGVEKKAAIREMLEVSQARQIADQVFEVFRNQLVPAIQRENPGERERIREIVREEIGATMDELLPDLMAVTATVWAKHFTTEEIRGLTDFYRTPLGQKLIEKQPIVMQEAMQASFQISQDMGQQVMQRVRKRLQAENLKVPETL